MQNPTLAHQIELQSEAIAINMIELHNSLQGRINETKTLAKTSQGIQTEAMNQLCGVVLKTVDSASQLVAMIQEAKDHLRMHTLEKPFICPIKSCRMAYALKPNCIAHGKTRHNRLIKPIYFDIIKGEEVVEDDAIEEDEVPEEIDYSTRKVGVAELTSREKQRSKRASGASAAAAVPRLP
ncbi:hypothetical protein HDV03_001420 [Kappamyces sp. JEL0829]|nr:hypothetical protein HDV03_001420 [Kappamyces sp. JEL0829]